MPLAARFRKCLLPVAGLLAAGGRWFGRAARPSAAPQLRLHEGSSGCGDDARIAALRRLIAEADAAAARLAMLISESESRGERALLPFDELSRASRTLKQAGYSDEQIEKLLDRCEIPIRRAA